MCYFDGNIEVTQNDRIVLYLSISPKLKNNLQLIHSNKRKNVKKNLLKYYSLKIYNLINFHNFKMHNNEY